MARSTPISKWLALASVVATCGCQSIERFDTTNGAAYCGSIVLGDFVHTSAAEGGFQNLRMRLEIDTGNLTTIPGHITTDDAKDGPCQPQPTFQDAPLRVTPEVVQDPLSAMTFEDGQVRNLVAWADSTCRGTVLSVVSLYKDEHVEVRLLKPADTTTAGVKERDAFALFSLVRQPSGCGY